MKHLFCLLLFSTRAFAQWIVNDPLNTAVNMTVQAGQAANHIETMRQWAAQLENLNRQLRQLEEQLVVQQRIRDVLGDPRAAGVGIVLHGLGADELARTSGETLDAVQRLANALESLQRTSEGIYQRLEGRTSLGHGFVRQENLYRRFAALERQADNFIAVQAEADRRSAAFQREIAATLVRLKEATTQADVDKLNAQLAALHGQVAHLDAQRRAEADKLAAQQTLNENQAAKEQQDLLERQLAEESQTLEVVRHWQEGIKLEPTTYSRP